MSVRKIAQRFTDLPHQRDGLADAAALVARILARRGEFTPTELAAILLAVLRDQVFGDLEDPRLDAELGEPVALGAPPAPPATPGDPRPHLDTLGIPWTQDTDPGYGYDGTFAPQMVFAHWTASAAGTDTARSVLEARHYHSCVARDGVAHLGGWQVRQGHGGSGRVAPQGLARNGVMTLDDLKAWQLSDAADDTDSGANSYGVSVCLDNNGTGERPSSAAGRGFTATVAAFLHSYGWDIGHFIDHDASTVRKIDLGHSPAFNADDYWHGIEVNLQLLTGGPGAVTTAVDVKVAPEGGYYILDTTGRVYTFPWPRGAKTPAHYGDPTTPPATPLGSPASALEVVDNGGYYILEENGGVHAFGHAQPYGSAYEYLNP